MFARDGEVMGDAGIGAWKSSWRNRLPFLSMTCSIMSPSKRRWAKKLNDHHSPVTGSTFGCAVTAVLSSLPLKSQVEQGFQRIWIDLGGMAVFAQGEEAAMVVDRVGVGGVVAVFLRRGGIVGEGVAVFAVEAAAGGVLGLVALGLHIAAAEVDMAALEAEHRDMPSPLMMMSSFSVGYWAVGAGAIEAAFELARDFADDFAVAHIGLEAQGPLLAVETFGGVEGFRHCLLHAS